MKNAESLVQLIPDIFYDTLAYLLPASFLFVGVVTISSPTRGLALNAYLSLSDTFDKLIVVVLGLGVLYIAGQLLTFISYEVIQRPMRAYASWRKNEHFPKSDLQWAADHAFIRHKDAALGLEITKRYARVILARNNTFVSLIFITVSVVSKQEMWIIINAVLFLLFLYETYGRRIFFYQYVMNVAKELRQEEKETETRKQNSSTKVRTRQKAG